ncbi:hypothetical protein J1N35_010379, partial [Gossypium stocksii]
VLRPFNVQDVKFNAMCHLMDAKLDFDVLYPSGAMWDKFTEDWKISDRLFLASGPTETSTTNKDVESDD